MQTITERPVDSTNPSHYRDPPDTVQFPDAREGEECIDYMLRTKGRSAVAYFCELNAIKHRWRAGRKEGVEADKDRAKAEWYTAMREYAVYGNDDGSGPRDPRLAPIGTCSECGGSGEGPDKIDGPGEVYRDKCGRCGGSGKEP